MFSLALISSLLIAQTVPCPGLESTDIPEIHKISERILGKDNPITFVIFGKVPPVEDYPVILFCSGSDDSTIKQNPDYQKIELENKNFTTITEEEIAIILKISKQQVARHRRTLICEGLITVAIMGIAFCSGAYCGFVQEEQDLDEWIESRIELPTLEIVEDLKWQFNL